MRTLILGFDAFDPLIFERLNERGQTPNLARYVDTNSYSQLEVSNPPQSEVSWTSIATGLNPGEHGLFDFVHRNPRTYNLNVSLLPTSKTITGQPSYAHISQIHFLMRRLHKAFLQPVYGGQLHSLHDLNLQFGPSLAWVLQIFMDDLE